MGDIRATHDNEKAARRATIIDAAAALFQSEAFATLTMASVARRCGLAKGTVYLYFRSKEELFLALFEERLDEWFNALADRLRPGQTPDDISAAITGSLVERPLLRKLLGLLHGVLEAKVDLDTAAAFKRRLRDRLRVGAEIVRRALPRIDEDGGIRLLLRLHAITVGLELVAHPPPNIETVLAADDLAMLRVDFAHEHQHMTRALVDAATRGE